MAMVTKWPFRCVPLYLAFGQVPGHAAAGGE